MGQPGTGAAAKLINQLLTASNALAATEALALARAMGFDSAARLAPLLALLERSWGNSTMVQRTGGIFGAAIDAAEPTAALLTPAAAPLRNFAKDLDYVLAEAATAHLRLPATAAARTAVSRAAGLGRDGADWASVALQHQAPPAAP